MTALTSIEIHWPTVSDVSTVVINEVTSVVPVVVVVVGIGVIGVIGFAIWSGIQSWRMRKAGQPVVPGGE